MLDILKKWATRYFASEEVLVLGVLLLVFALSVVFMGGALIPIFIAIALAYILQGMVQRLTTFGVPKLLAISVVELVFILVLLAIAMILLPLVWHQLKLFVRELPNMLAKMDSTLTLYAQQYPEWISAVQIEELNEGIKSKLTALAKRVLSFSFTGLSNAFTILIYSCLIPVLVFFFLKDKDQIIGWLTGFLPKERPFMNELSSEVNGQIANYIRGKALEIFIVGIACFILLTLLDVRYAVLLSVLTGLSVLVPYFGAGAVGIGVVTIAFFQFGLSMSLLYVFVGYGILQVLDGNVLVPILFSEAVNLHPVAILVAVLIFGSMWGFWGLFFAIPLATLLNALINSWPRPRQLEEQE